MAMPTEQQLARRLAACAKSCRHQREKEEVWQEHLRKKREQAEEQQLNNSSSINGPGTDKPQCTEGHPVAEQAKVAGSRGQLRKEAAEQVQLRKEAAEQVQLRKEAAEHFDAPSSSSGHDASSADTVAGTLAPAAPMQQAPRPKTQPVEILDDESERSERPLGPRCATLPAGSFDMFDEDLASHFHWIQLHSSQIKYTTTIDPDCLHMQILDRDAANTYIAVKLPHAFVPDLAIIRPHLSVVHNATTTNWDTWFRMKHRLATLLSARKITCFFRARVSHVYKFVVDDNSELGVLIRMMQEVIAEFHVGPHPLDRVQELHMTFHQLNHHTV